MPAEPERFDYYKATTLEPFQDKTRDQLETELITRRKEMDIKDRRIRELESANHILAKEAEQLKKAVDFMLDAAVTASMFLNEGR